MRKCPLCGSNLLAHTVECPICAMPDQGAHLRASAHEIAAGKSNKNLLLIVVGVFIPALGILFLAIYLAQKFAHPGPPVN